MIVFRDILEQIECGFFKVFANRTLPVMEFDDCQFLRKMSCFIGLKIENDGILRFGTIIVCADLC